MFSKLGIEGDLKLSLLSEMVKADGSSKYIYDRKTSAKEAIVTLKYSAITHHEVMTMDQLKNIDYPDVLETISATHFVIGIDYGVEAIFVFKQTCTSREQLHDLTANLKASLDAIVEPLTSTKGSANPEAICNKRGLTNDFTCEYYGDVILPSPLASISSIEKAVDACSCLASNKETCSIPKVIYLRPISDLNIRIPRQSLFSVSSEMIMKIEEIMDCLNETEIECRDLKDNEGCEIFHSIAKRIDRFSKILKAYKEKLTCKLSKKLLKVRKNGRFEVLESLVNSIAESPFSNEKLKSFIDGVHDDFCVLDQLRENVPESDVPKVVHAFSNECGKLKRMVVNKNYEQIFCLTLNCVSKQDAFVEAMRNFLVKKETSTACYVSIFENQSELVERSQEFLKFADSNKQNKKIVFVVSEESVGIKGIEASGPVIVRYVSGKASIFKAPPAPTDVVIEHIGRKDFKLSWHLEEREGFMVKEYKVHFRNVNKCKWNTLTVKQSPARVNNLPQWTTYEFKIEAIFQCGISSLCPSETCEIRNLSNWEYAKHLCVWFCSNVRGLIQRRQWLHMDTS